MIKTQSDPFIRNLVISQVCLRHPKSNLLLFVTVLLRSRSHHVFRGLRIINFRPEVLIPSMNSCSGLNFQPRTSKLRWKESLLCSNNQHGEDQQPKSIRISYSKFSLQIILQQLHRSSTDFFTKSIKYLKKNDILKLVYVSSIFVFKERNLSLDPNKS